VASYVIRVAGRLSSRLLRAFPTLRARVEPVHTTLVGQLPDQGALTGVLNYLDELGVEIVEVIRLPDVDDAVPDTAVPDTAVPDTAVPDTAVPDTAVPDTAVPDTGDEAHPSVIHSMWGSS